jgi:large repetitive protein
MNKRFYSIKAKNSKLIAGFFLLFFVFIFQNSLVSQTTLYSENMDNGSGGNNGDAISVHEANDRFEQVGLTYSGLGADMRTTLPSSGYVTASGGFNVMLNGAGENFIIDGLDLTTCLSNIVISFGVKKSTLLADGSNLKLQYSTDGVTGSFSNVSYTLLPTGSGTASDYYYVSTTSIIPSNVTTIRFVSLDAVEYRIDDILIACNTVACANPTFIAQPIDYSICEDESFTLYAPANGTGTLTFQWQVDMGSGFVNLTDDATYTGTVNDTLEVNNVVGTMNGYKFRCIVTDGACSTSSNTSNLTVTIVPVPTITASGPLTFCKGGNVLLTSSATTGNLWTNAELSTTQSILVTQSGEYSVKVTVGLCSETSAPTTVTVEDPSFSIGEITLPTFCGTPDGSIKLQGLQAGEVTFTTYNDFYPTDPIVPAVTQPATLPYTISGLIRGDWEIVFTTPIGCVAKDSVLLQASLPVPTITASLQTLTVDYRAEFCQPDSIILTSSAENDNTWQRLTNGSWVDFASTRDITVKVTDTLRVSVTSGPCTEVSDTAFILVNRLPVITASLLGSGSENPSGCTLLDGFIEITGDTLGLLSWNGPVTNTNPNTDLDLAPNTFTITGLSAGLYKIALFDGKCTTDTISFTLTDPGAPTAPVITNIDPLTFCDGDSVDLTITLDPDPLVIYTWYNGLTEVQTGGDSYRAYNSGSYTVSASLAGCISTSDAVAVTENPYPAVPMITNSDANDSICTGTSVTLTSSIASAYNWMPGNLTTRSITVSTGGNYTVEITENGCSTVSAIKTIFENDTTSLIFGTINLPSICGSSDATVQILDLKDSDEANGTLDWTGPVSNSAAISALPYVITSLSSGTYDISITTPLGCVGYSQLIINDQITVPTIALGTNDTVTFCKGGNVRLISSSSSGNQWTWNGNPIAGATSQVFATDSSGVYAVTVTIGSCITPSLDTIVTVIDLPVISEGTLTSPSLCGFQDGTIEIVGSGIGDLTWTGRMSGDSLNLDFTQNINITDVFAGSYTFTFFDGTCTSLPLDVTLNELSFPTTPVITASGPTTFCKDNGSSSVTLTASTSTGTYTWSNGDSGVGLDNITVNESSNYYVTITEGLCEVTSDVVNVTVINNPLPPSIVANGATTFCDGGSVVLTASTSNGILWSTSESTQSITVSDPITVTAIIQENGCNSVASNSITIVENAIPVITLGTTTNPTTCGGTDGAVTINGTASGNLEWSGQMSSSISGTLPLTATGLEAGTYSFVLNDGNCLSNAIPVTLVGPSNPPVPTITSNDADNTICAGQSVVLTSSSLNNNQWSSGGPSTRNFTVTSAGTYTVSVTVAGCTSTSAPVTVTVNPIPATPSIIAQGSTTFCTGGNVNLAANVSNGSLLWSNNATTQTINVTNSGSFTLTVTQDGCTSAPSAATVVTVNPNPPVPTITSSTGSFQYCEGGSIQLTSSATSGNTWSNAITTQSQTVSNSGTFTVSVTNNGCTSISNPVIVTEKNTPVATLPAYNQLCDTNDVFILNQGVVSDFTVGVGFTTNYTVDGATQTSFDPSVGAGNYTVVFTVTQDGCSDSDSQVITVVDCEPLTATLDENTKSSFLVYPNPTSSEITITGDKLNQIKQILVVDGLGRTVIVEDVTSTTIKIDMSSLANGMYSLMIKEDNSFVSIQRVQVLR